MQHSVPLPEDNPAAQHSAGWDGEASEAADVQADLPAERIRQEGGSGGAPACRPQSAGHSDLQGDHEPDVLQDCRDCQRMCARQAD